MQLRSNAIIQPFTMLKNHIKIALRHFTRHKLFTLINVAGLTIGVTAALVMYLIIHYHFTFDREFSGGDRMYRVVSDFTFAGEPNHNGGVTHGLPEAAAHEVTGLEQSTPFETANSIDVLIKNGARSPVKFKDQSNVIYADKRYFKFFPYKWLAGAPTNEPNQVVLTDAQAKKYFPSLSLNQILGRQVIYNDTIRTTVAGIVQERHENTNFMFHDMISYATQENNPRFAKQLKNWGSTNGSSQFYIQLLPGTQPKAVERQLNALLKKYNPPKARDKGNTRAFALQPLADIHFNTDYYAYDTPAISKNVLYGLMAIAAFLLLLGCINFINLTTAQASQRAKEIGIRKTMGSTRPQLMAQYLSETFIVTLIAIVLALALTPLILKLFADFIPQGIKSDYLHQPDILIFLLGLAIVVSLLAGFYPSMVLSSFQPVSVLKNQAYSGTAKTRSVWLRKSLTVTQFIIAQFFIMATLLVSKQINFALNKDLGFKKDAILVVNLPWKDNNATHKQVFVNEVKVIPQIEVMSLGQDVPSSDNYNSTDVTYTDGKKEIKTELQLKSGDENYIKVYHIRLLAGRNITQADTASAMLVNNTYARLLGFSNPQQALGKSVDFGEIDQYHRHLIKRIVGVMTDFYQNSLHAPIKPLAFSPEKEEYEGALHIALKPKTGPNDWKQAISSMQSAWKTVYPDYDFDYYFFDENIAKFYDSEQHIAKLLTWATGLSIFISCLGLLGLAIYTTNQRTKEIGVRKVLGASVAQIIRLLSAELVALVLLAFVLVTPLAWWASHAWMQNFAEHTPISWWLFALSGAGMLLAALITVSFNSVQAATANPVQSLRSE